MGGHSNFNVPEPFVNWPSQFNAFSDRVIPTSMYYRSEGG